MDTLLSKCDKIEFQSVPVHEGFSTLEIEHVNKNGVKVTVCKAAQQLQVVTNRRWDVALALSPNMDLEAGNTHIVRCYLRIQWVL